MREAESNRLRRWTRTAWACTGLGGFLWVGFEDSSAVVVVLLAGMLCFAAGLSLIGRRRRSGRTHGLRIGPARWVLAAALLGAAVGPIAAVLMVVKTGLHGHIPPDFSLRDVLDMLQRTPVWGMAGGLLGLAWWVGLKAADPHDVR